MTYEFTHLVCCLIFRIITGVRQFGFRRKKGAVLVVVDGHRTYVVKYDYSFKSVRTLSLPLIKKLEKNFSKTVKQN